MRKLLILSPGCGIGPEIALKAILETKGLLPVFPLLDSSAAERLESMFSVKLNPSETYRGPLSYYPIKPGGCVGESVFRTLEKAARLCLQDKGNRVLVTGPLNKRHLCRYMGEALGHTELLCRMTGVSRAETVFALENLKVFFLSRHMSLSQAVACVTRENVLAALKRADGHMKSLGVAAPRIAVAALNPHGGDGGLFGDEDDLEVRPAVEDAAAAGIGALGPIGADTVFHLGFQGSYDAVLSLYHDQGHIALKTRNFFETVTMTLGLPFLRTSVDHGSADDIAWQGKADAQSMLCALRLAWNLLGGGVNS